eukprot:15401035-Alexandrium_andersonii.AAC.1
MLMLLASVRSCFFIVEQPHESLLYQFPPMQMVKELTNSTFLHTWLGGFGHSMPKPSRLFTNLPHKQ